MVVMLLLNGSLIISWFEIGLFGDVGVVGTSFRWFGCPRVRLGWGEYALNLKSNHSRFAEKILSEKI